MDEKERESQAQRYLEYQREVNNDHFNSENGGIDAQKTFESSPSEGIGRHWQDRPVIGINAENATEEQLARTALRAHHYNLDLFVAYREGADPGLIELEHMPNVILRPLPDAVDAESIRDTLSMMARTRGYPGMLYLSNPAAKLDFEQSLASLKSQSEFDIDAVTESGEADTTGSVIVGIPAYNEEQTIAEVVRKARVCADEVLVVDDGSDDNTAERAAEAGATVVTHRRNFGYGAALKTLFKEANHRSAAHLVILDGDGQHTPEDIESLVETQKEEAAEIVIGSRFIDGASTDAPVYRRFGLKAVNILTNASLGMVRSRSRINDTQSGFRAYDRYAIESLADDETISDHMTASTDILYHALRHGYTISEAPTVVSYEVDNASSYHPVSHGLTLVNNILRTVESKYPVAILGVPGFITLSLGFGFGYWTVHNIITTGTFPGGLALISMFFTLAGVLACFTAIILHSLNVTFATD